MNKTDIPGKQKEALAMLIDDHNKVRKLFKAFEKEKDEQKKQEIVQEACFNLTVHTQLEEKTLYPFLRECDSEKYGSMLNEALVEHGSAKDLIAQISGMTPDDALWEAKFTVLGEYVNHHVEEEEEEMFKQIIKDKIDLTELAEQMKEAREALEAKQKA